MSRTHAHAPEHTRYTAPEARTAIHDHRRGACDLPTPDQWARILRRGGFAAAWSTYRCRWQLRYHALPRLCGCAICTSADDRRAQRRAQRHATAQTLRRLTGLPAADAADLADDHPV